MSLYLWFEMYDHYRRSSQWPDGGSFLTQPAIAVQVFQVIEHQLAKEEKLSGKRN